jgi:hypothetical protein
LSRGALCTRVRRPGLAVNSCVALDIGLVFLYFLRASRACGQKSGSKRSPLA